MLLVAVVSNAAGVQVAPRETGPSAEVHYRPLIVADGEEVVVIWNSASVPRFARIGRSHEVLLTGDFGRPGSVLAAVAGPGGSVLAAFGDAGGIHLATIRRGGEVHVSEDVAPSFSAMAWNGSTLLIVTRSGSTILTDENGRVLGHGPDLRLPERGSPAASARGSGFVVASVERHVITVTTLTSTGAVSEATVIGERQIGSVAIGCNESGSCLLLTAAGEPLSGQILGRSPVALFRISAGLVADAFPPVWDGRRFLVAWTDYSFGARSMQARIQVAAVALDGTVTPIATIASSDRNRDTPAIAFARGETVVAWSDSPRCGSGGSQIVTRALSSGRELRLTHGLSVQTEPAIASGAATSLIVWTERSDRSRIRARLYPFTAPAFDVSSGPFSRAAAVASDGSGYLVAWLESLPEDECRSAVQISAIGSGRTSTLGRGADPGTRPQITWNGSEYVVLWEQQDPAELRAMRVDAAGQPLDPVPVPLTPAEADPDAYTTIDHDPAGLFWIGDRYLLVWRRSRVTYIPFYPDPPPQFDVRTTVLGPTLVPAGAPQVAAPSYDVVATSKGSTIVAVWRRGSTLHAVQLTSAGAVLAERDLGIVATPLRIVPMRSGYAVLFHNEIVFLDDALRLTGRRPTAGPNAALAETATGLVEVYEADGAVWLSPPEARRRRSVR